jgi:RimJ/RimL family protein N-acetyltransferase
MFPELSRDDVFRLETRRLWLRWPQAGDAAAIRVLQPYGAQAPRSYGLEEAQSFIEASRAGNACGAFLRMVLTLKSGARDVIGLIGIEEKAQPQLCYWLAPAFRGQGFAAEAASAMTDAFFHVTPAEELRAFGEGASVGVLQKAGFVRRIDAQSPNGLFALDRATWRAREARVA